MLGGVMVWLSSRFPHLPYGEQVRMLRVYFLPR